MNNNAHAAVELLRSPMTIRQRSEQLFKCALEQKSSYYKLALEHMDSCAAMIKQMIATKYPTFDIPFHSRWRHFEAGGKSRLALLKQHPNFPTTSIEQGRNFFELTIVSVLLDAGAGSKWHYKETPDSPTLGRSEGLAVASFDMYQQGLFSHDGSLTVTTEGLKTLSMTTLSKAMQVSTANPLVGLEGRFKLIQQLAHVIENEPMFFENTNRLGKFYDYVINHCAQDTRIDAANVLAAVLRCFASIWPGRIAIEGTNLGDVWKHSAIQGEGLTNGLIPFHKLSQWLTYSLLEPLQWSGYHIVNLDQLTGLAEYRNGGLFIDSGVIEVIDPSLLEIPQAPANESIVEWRALTICLLDKLWGQLLQEYQMTKATFPLVKLLEAGTWQAGRALAYQRRLDGSPPINIKSDGTVF